MENELFNWHEEADGYAMIHGESFLVNDTALFFMGLKSEEEKWRTWYSSISS